jgi:hypothetical protein
MNIPSRLWTARWPMKEAPGKWQRHPGERRRRDLELGGDRAARRGGYGGREDHQTGLAP